MPRNLTIRQWIVPACNASFAPGEKLDAARGARAFLDRLKSLPVTTERDEPSVTDWQDYDPNRWNLH